MKLTGAKTLDKLAQIRKIVSKFGEPKEYDPDFDAQSASGGNFDDCWNMGRDEGYNEGEKDLAEHIKQILDE